jgi:hypothetical protein
MIHYGVPCGARTSCLTGKRDSECREGCLGLMTARGRDDRLRLRHPTCSLLLRHLCCQHLLVRHLLLLELVVLINVLLEAPSLLLLHLM